MTHTTSHKPNTFLSQPGLVLNTAVIAGITSPVMMMACMCCCCCTC